MRCVRAAEPTSRRGACERQDTDPASCKPVLRMDPTALNDHDIQTLPCCASRISLPLVPPSLIHSAICEGGHNRDAKGCITHAAPAARVHHLHHDVSPASTLHQPCTNPASRAKGCINPASAAHGLHHAHQGTRKPKHQAPSTQVTQNHPYARCPLPHAPPKQAAGVPSQRARAQRARAKSAPR